MGCIEQKCSICWWCVHQSSGDKTGLTGKSWKTVTTSWVVKWPRLDWQLTVLYTVVHHTEPHPFHGFKCACDWQLNAECLSELCSRLTRATWAKVIAPEQGHMQWPINARWGDDRVLASCLNWDNSTVPSQP